VSRLPFSSKLQHSMALKLKLITFRLKPESAEINYVSIGRHAHASVLWLWKMHFLVWLFIFVAVKQDRVMGGAPTTQLSLHSLWL
jgi:hypothetical protein